MESGILRSTGISELLREGNVAAFNALRSSGEKIDLENCNLRGADLKKADIKGINLKGAYLGYTDMRGLDLSTCCLVGASIKNAKISGVYFPEDISAGEITLSLAQGTRLRAGKIGTN